MRRRQRRRPNRGRTRQREANETSNEGTSSQPIHVISGGVEIPTSSSLSAALKRKTPLAVASASSTSSSSPATPPPQVSRQSPSPPSPPRDEFNFPPLLPNGSITTATAAFSLPPSVPSASPPPPPPSPFHQPAAAMREQEAISRQDHAYAQQAPLDDNILADLPPLEEILRARVRTVTHIPKAARRDWSKVFAKTLSGIINEPSSKPRWRLLLLVAKCLLAAPARGGKRHQHQLAAIVKGRVERWRKGEISALWKEVTAPEDRPQRRGRQRQPPPTAPSQGDFNRCRCHRLVQEGQFSRGVQALTSRGIDQSSSSAYNAMVDKHPYASLPPKSSEPSPTPTPLTTDQVKKGVLSFCRP